MSNIDERIQKGIQYRNLILEARANEADTQEEYIVEGYASTFNEPYVLWDDEETRFEEQVDARAFDEADMEDVIFQYNHEGRVFARRRNNTLEITPDEKGLYIKANLGGTEEGRKLYEEIKGGYTDRMSFGFIVDEDNVFASDRDSKRVYLRTITRIKKVFDVSAVSLPANDGTSISARSYFDGILEEEKKEALRVEEEKRKRLALRIKLMEV